MPPDAAGAERVRETIFGADEVKPEPPRPLMRELPPADPFPVDALGDVLGAAAHGINDRVQAPMAICGQSVLAAATLAVQGHADVVLPIGNGSRRPVSCFFITVAATGERKTECDRQALWPIEKHESALREAYGADLPRYENAKAAWDKAKEAAVKKGKGDRAAIENALNALGPAPAAAVATDADLPGADVRRALSPIRRGLAEPRNFCERRRPVHRRTRHVRRQQTQDSRGPVEPMGRRADQTGSRRRRGERAARSPPCGAPYGATRRCRFLVPGPSARRPGDDVSDAGHGT